MVDADNTVDRDAGAIKMVLGPACLAIRPGACVYASTFHVILIRFFGVLIYVGVRE